MKISFVIPAHNENSNLKKLIKEIYNFAKGKYIFETIIVDDNSIDSTDLIADELAKEYSEVEVIHRAEGRRNFGLSLRRGTEKSTGEFVIWLMADRCDYLNTIDKIIDKLRMGVDLVIASRYMEEGDKGSLSVRRTILSKIYSLMCRLIFDMKVNDVTNAYRGFRKEIFESIILKSEGFSISPEFSIKTYIYGGELDEVPTLHLGRESKRSLNEIIKLGWQYLKLFRFKFQ